jgi:ABC-type multidrug transport system fused ATPase/permease subunit
MALNTLLIHHSRHHNIKRAWLREQMAFVTSVKDTFLFSTTVRENIEFGVSAGLGRIVASYNRPSTSYQIH